MTITLRSTKGSSLTHAELDGNFEDLDGRINISTDSDLTNDPTFLVTREVILDAIVDALAGIEGDAAPTRVTITALTSGALTLGAQHLVTAGVVLVSETGSADYAVILPDSPGEGRYFGYSRSTGRGFLCRAKSTYAFDGGSDTPFTVGEEVQVTSGARSGNKAWLLSDDSGGGATGNITLVAIRDSNDEPSTIENDDPISGQTSGATATINGAGTHSTGKLNNKAFVKVAPGAGHIFEITVVDGPGGAPSAYVKGDLEGEESTIYANVQVNGHRLIGWVDEISGMIEEVADQTYVLVQSAKYPFDINSLTLESDSGTCDMAVQIDGTPVTGINGVGVSSTEATYTATAANAVAVGGLVTLVPSSISSAVLVGFSLEIERT